MRPSFGKRVVGYSAVLVWGSSLVWSCSSEEREYGDTTEAGAGGDSAQPVAGSGSDPSSLGGAGPMTSGGAGGEGGEGGGSAGSGGEGGTAEPSPLSVLSKSPLDGATDVEREPVVEAVFSTDVDPATVTSSTFWLVGPAGKVSGSLDVDGATVTFEPDQPLVLLGEYTLKLTAGIRSTEGQALTTSPDTAFRVRDGVFGTPQRIATGSSLNLNVVGSDAGNVAVSWAGGEAIKSFVVAIFDPVSRTWGPATEVETDTQYSHSSGSVGLNARGEAFAITDSTKTLWNRFDGDAWGSAKSDGVAERRFAALADDGTAMTFWYDPPGNYGTVYAASQSRAGAWSASAPIDTNARTWTVERYGNGFLALTDREASKAIYAHIYEPGTGWLQARPVTKANASANWISLATTRGAALFTWYDASNMAMASVFDGAAWTPETLGPIAGGTKAAASLAGFLAAWISGSNTYAAVNTGGIWGDPIKLGVTNAEYGIGAEVDDLGHALVAWPNGSDLSWRRLAGGGWSAVHQLADQDPGIVFSEKDASGNVMLVWSNPVGIWASRFE